MNFVDFKKAFDSMHRPSMWRVLKHYGIPEKIINIIKGMYDESNCSVRVGHEQLNIQIGFQLKQGCGFILSKLEHTDGGITWMETEKLKDLDYAMQGWFDD